MNRATTMKMFAPIALTILAALSASALPQPIGPDLEVTFINRSPMYERYRLTYQDGKPLLEAGTESDRHWPTNGEIVTFTAHIANRGTTASAPSNYKWFMDGSQVAAGALPGLAVGQETTVTYQWVWSHQMNGERVLDQHYVRCVVDANNTVAESFENNNSLEDATAAMSLRFVIRPEMITKYSAAILTNTPFSAENWMQRQIAAMNTNFARSQFALFPNGSALRVRINEILIASSEGLDYANDGGWFVDNDYRVVSGGFDPATDIDWSLVHELSHQVGLIDNYNYDIESDSVHVLNARGLPCNFGFRWPRPDLMGGGDVAPYSDERYYSPFTIGGAEATVGFRRGYFGEFQYDISRTNFVRVVDNQGQPAAGVQVSLYQRQDNGQGREIDNTPEIVGVTDANGRLQLTNRPVSGELTTRTGHTLRDNPFGLVDVVGNYNSFLVKLSHNEHEEFAWLNISDFNLAFWAGQTNSAEFAFYTHIPPDGAPSAPTSLTTQIAGSSATLCWNAVPGAVGYYVYAAYRPEYAYQNISGLVSGNCFTVTNQNETRIYAVVAVDASGRASGFSQSIWSPLLLNPRAVVTTSDGRRIVLDPQDGHSLIEMAQDGSFIRNIGSVHYDFTFSRFLTADSSDRLVITHPANVGSPQQTVRIASREATPIHEFGELGAGDGQFETPTGVAVYGRPKSIEGPWSAGQSALLLLHLDGSYNGAQGESGAAANTSFAAGKYGQGVLVANNGTLSYPSAGNFIRDQGAVEFWFKPNWDGTNTATRYFFANGEPFNDGFQIVKDGANNLRFMRWRGAEEDGISYNINHWQAEEWHHIAVTWTAELVALYVDGQLRASKAMNPMPDTIAPTLHIGSSQWGDSQSDGIFDEFRISSVARVGNSDNAVYTIIVADSSNHRIQAFNEFGGFLGTFGSLGNNTFQFNEPCGVAANSLGKIMVADRNNNRLQVLTFDGTNFSALITVNGQFNHPTGVAAYGGTHWIVADTGNNQIKILDSVGTLLGSYSAPNDGNPGNFLAPEGVTTDRSGNILVADTGNRRVVELRGLLPPIIQPRFLPEFTRWQPASGFTTRIATSPGQRLLIQKSSDLSHWFNIRTISTMGETEDFQDGDAPAEGQWFYRALVQ